MLCSEKLHSCEKEEKEEKEEKVVVYSVKEMMPRHILFKTAGDARLSSTSSEPVPRLHTIQRLQAEKEEFAFVMP
jgi:hypothetical protein